MIVTLKKYKELHQQYWELSEEYSEFVINSAKTEKELREELRKETDAHYKIKSQIQSEDRDPERGARLLNEEQIKCGKLESQLARSNAALDTANGEVLSLKAKLKSAEEEITIISNQRS